MSYNTKLFSLPVSSSVCQDPQIDNPSSSNAILRNSAASRWSTALTSLLPSLLWYCNLPDVL